MSKRQDLPLKKDIAARFVPKIVALMVYLGTLCFVFALFMIQSIQLWETQLTTDLSIEIPILPGVSSGKLQSQVLQLLNHTPGIQHATAVPQNEMANLFRSLLGEEVNVEMISFPIIIDVSLNGKEKIDIQSLEKHLKNISPHLQLIDHRNWQAQVSDLIRTSVFITFTLTVLIVCAALATTNFATRTSLLIHRQVIEVLSLIGATNSYIAKQFQLNALKQGFVASTVGSFFAFLTFLGIITSLEKIGLPFFGSSAFYSQALIVFIFAPFFTAFLIMISVRLSVMKALHR